MRIGNTSTEEKEYKSANTPFIRYSSLPVDSPQIFRIVRRITVYDTIFIQCIGSDGNQYPKAFKCRSKEFNILDEICAIDRKIINEEYKKEEKKPYSSLSRQGRALFLAFERLENNRLILLELTKKMSDDIQHLRNTTDARNISFLEYGLPYMFDISIEKVGVSTVFKYEYKILPKASPSCGKIPTDALDDSYPTLQMVHKFLLDNKDDFNKSEKELKVFFDKYKKEVKDGIIDYTFDEEEIRDKIVLYEKSLLLEFFTPDEIEDIELFDYNDEMLSYSDNKNILATLKETPMDLYGKNKFGYSLFIDPSSLIQKIKKELNLISGFCCLDGASTDKIAETINDDNEISESINTEDEISESIDTEDAPLDKIKEIKPKSKKIDEPDNKKQDNDLPDFMRE